MITGVAEKAWKRSDRVRSAVLRRRSAYIIRTACAGGAHIAENTRIPPRSTLTGHTRIGDRTAFTGPVFIEGPGEVEIGSWAAIGHGLRVVTTSHDINHANMHMPLQVELGLPTFHSARGPVSIGSATWIGDGVTVLGDVIIGDGAVVGAGSLVTSAVPPFAVAAGNPARVIRHRFNPDVIEALVSINWWHWPIDRIHRNRRFFEADLTTISGPQVLDLVQP